MTTPEENAEKSRKTDDTVLHPDRVQAERQERQRREDPDATREKLAEADANTWDEQEE
ncbi:hypothetical protein [Streptomyces niger]|uniref:hypothetical protein n=1 Tax=Streptomyces niger TaxID=66373 RepID=UPI000A8FA654|nr:hypothetical protein [Streptomyces niger]